MACDADSILHDTDSECGDEICVDEEDSGAEDSVSYHNALVFIVRVKCNNISIITAQALFTCIYPATVVKDSGLRLEFWVFYGFCNSFISHFSVAFGDKQANK